MPNYIKEVCEKLVGMKNQDMKEIFDYTKEQQLKSLHNSYLS